MRAISAALIVLSGSLLLATALAVNRNPDGFVVAIIGIVLGLFGLIAWFVAFLIGDKNRS
jgi:hypothetical protein